MRVAIDYRELTEERYRAQTADPRVRPELWQAVRRAAFRAERQIKIRMPVDIGRARASWGHSTPPSHPGDGIWEENEGALSIVQGSNVEYMQRLNEGWSRQAPAGFIDAEAESAIDELADEIMDIMQRLL